VSSYYFYNVDKLNNNTNFIQETFVRGI